MRILKKGNSNTNSLAYTSLMRPILEYGVACWGPYREGQINALDRVQKNTAKIAHHRNESNWETLTECRKLARLCAVFNGYTGERAWNAVEDRLQTPCYLSRGDHGKKIRSRKQRTDIGKYSFVHRTMQLWTQLPEVALGAPSSKPSSFKKSVREVINKAK
jgi:hypothetical protein